MTSMVYVLFSSLSKACTVFSSPEYFPIEKYFFVSPWREYLHRKTKNMCISVEVELFHHSVFLNW